MGIKSIRIKITILQIIIMFFPSTVFSSILFFEDFETGLSQWTTNYSGVIVDDPLENDKALSFTSTNWAGDIISQQISNPSGNYILSFDYLGTCLDNDCGGYIGYEPGDSWLGGTGADGVPDLLLDTGEWEHVVINFSAPTTLSLQLEDFRDSGSTAGDAFFDNILLTDANGPSSVPVPATVWLFGSGLLGLIGVARRKKT